MSAARATGWLMMTTLAVGVAFASLRYFSLSSEVFFPQQRAVYESHLPMLLLHVGGGVAALLLGPWQFWSRLRARHLQLHRWLGRLYVCAVGLGGVGGLYMAPLAYGGAPARLGFAALALIWLSATGMAWRQAKGRRLRSHRRWMIRSYALTFAAVTLRLWLPVLEAAGLAFTSAYIAVAWISWLPNLLVAEAFLALERSRSALASP